MGLALGWLGGGLGGFVGGGRLPKAERAGGRGGSPYRYFLFSIETWMSSSNSRGSQAMSLRKTGRTNKILLTLCQYLSNHLFPSSEGRILFVCSPLLVRALAFRFYSIASVVFAPNNVHLTSPTEVLVGLAKVTFVSEAHYAKACTCCHGGEDSLPPIVFLDHDCNVIKG